MDALSLQPTNHLPSTNTGKPKLSPIANLIHRYKCFRSKSKSKMVGGLYFRHSSSELRADNIHCSVDNTIVAEFHLPPIPTSAWAGHPPGPRRCQRDGPDPPGPRRCQRDGPDPPGPRRCQRDGPDPPGPRRCQRDGPDPPGPRRCQRDGPDPPGPRRCQRDGPVCFTDRATYVCMYMCVWITNIHFTVCREDIGHQQSRGEGRSAVPGGQRSSPGK